MFKGSKKKILIASVLATLLTVSAVTYAYFTARDSVDNDFSVGDLEIEVKEPGWKDPEEYNGGKLEKLAKVENVNTFPAIIRVAVEPRFEDEKGNFFEGNTNYVDFEFTNITTNPNDSDSWYDGKDGYYYYTSVVKPGESTKEIIKSIKLSLPDNSKVDYNNIDLKAVVIAEALFPQSNSWKTDWNDLNSDVQTLLTRLGQNK